MCCVTCPKCNIEFKFPSMLKTHFKRSYHCLLNEEEINNFFNSSNMNKCIKCKKQFNNIQAYKRHIKETKCGKLQFIQIPNEIINNTTNNNYINP